MEFLKSDWKLFRAKLPIWQENYMERLVKEYINLLSGKENASNKFWNLEKRIKIDRKNPGVILQLNKGNMIFDIIEMINREVITLADIEEFSNELKDRVKFIISSYNKE